MWHFEVNSQHKINLHAELAKDSASKGTWKDDFDWICKHFEIVPCPFINYDVATAACRISNCKIDSPSFTAALLACCTVGSTVNEIAIYNAELTSQDILDLKLTVEKMCIISVIKLERLSYSSAEAGGIHHALNQLITTASVDFLSLKGSRLGDEFLLGAVVALKLNCSMKALNLSDNDLTEESVAPLIQLTALHPSLRDISLSRNLCTGSILSQLTMLICGSEASADDETLSKAFVKLIGDKNKSIKDINKKRKKSGLADIPEFVVPPDRIVKINGKNTVLNRSVSTYDLSHNRISNQDVMDMVANIRSSGRPEVAAVAGVHDLYVILKDMTRSSLEAKEAYTAVLDGVNIVF